MIGRACERSNRRRINDPAAPIGNPQDETPGHKVEYKSP